MSKAKAKSKPKAKRAVVSDEDFSKIYANSSNAEEVSKATGLTVGSVRQRATRMRKELGIHLPKFPRSKSGGRQKSTPADVKRINAMLDNLAKETAKS